MLTCKLLKKASGVSCRRLVCDYLLISLPRRHFAQKINSMHRLFEGQDHAKAYAAYRPSFPPVTYDTILAFSREGGPGRSLAVDIGCGTGTSTRPLAPHFDHVIGLDISQAQTDNAAKDASNIEYRVGPAEDLSFLGDGSVDLITCAQAFHWLNTERLFAEVRRVLRPRGAFIAYGYGQCCIDRPEGQKLVSQVSPGKHLMHFILLSSAQDCGNSSALAMELPQACANPSMYRKYHYHT